MYAAGATHAHKAPSVAFLERVASNELDATIDAEVLQEILHRYRAIDHWTDGRRVYEAARKIVPLVLPVTAEILDTSCDFLERFEQLSARDALHAAVAAQYGASSICSYDRDFDGIAGIRRMEPDQY